jgi:hypothetical protein
MQEVGTTKGVVAVCIGNYYLSQNKLLYFSLAESHTSTVVANTCLTVAIQGVSKRNIKTSGMNSSESRKKKRHDNMGPEKHGYGLVQECIY